MLSSLACGEPFLYEARVRRADGEYRWMLHHKVAIRDEHGNSSSGTAPVLTSRIASRRKNMSAATPRSCKEARFISPKGSALDTWKLGLRCRRFRLLVSRIISDARTRSGQQPPSIQEYLDRVHSQDRESMADLIKGILLKASPSTLSSASFVPMVRSGTFAARCSACRSQSLKKFVGSAIDVTEHELLAQGLRRREAYLAEAHRLSHTGSFGWKPIPQRSFGQTKPIGFSNWNLPRNRP